MIDQRVRMFFESARLKQYPPAERTVFVYNKTARFRFPWMTFGAIQWEWEEGQQEVYPETQAHWDRHTSEMSTDLGSQSNKRLHRTIVNWLDRAMVMSDFAFVVVPLKSRSP